MNNAVKYTLILGFLGSLYFAFSAYFETKVEIPNVINSEAPKTVQSHSNLVFDGKRPFEDNKLVAPETFKYFSQKGELLLNRRSDLQLEILFQTHGSEGHFCKGHVIFTPFQDMQGYFYEQEVDGKVCKMALIIENNKISITTTPDCHPYFCGAMADYQGDYFQ